MDDRAFAQYASTEFACAAIHSVGVELNLSSSNCPSKRSLPAWKISKGRSYKGKKRLQGHSWMSACTDLLCGS